MWNFTLVESTCEAWGKHFHLPSPTNKKCITQPFPFKDSRLISSSKVMVVVVVKGLEKDWRSDSNSVARSAKWNPEGLMSNWA